MTKEEAWKIIEFNVGFNIQYFPSGMTVEERAILINRKKALALAWQTLGEEVPR